jgi:hypothetical protein
LWEVKNSWHLAKPGTVTAVKSPPMSCLIFVYLTRAFLGENSFPFYI